MRRTEDKRPLKEGKEKKKFVFVLPFTHKFLGLTRLFDDDFRLRGKDRFELNEIIYSSGYPADDEEVKLLFVSVRRETCPKINIDGSINANKTNAHCSHLLMFQQ